MLLSPYTCCPPDSVHMQQQTFLVQDKAVCRTRQDNSKTLYPKQDDSKMQAGDQWPGHAAHLL